jgi:NAD(P)-dependent dehydrogenase (short-subunit alcohol dehydrogenase family)
MDTKESQIDNFLIFGVYLYVEVRNMKTVTIDQFFDFKGKTVLVTGASSWIGQGIARSFAGAGADVGLHFHINREKAEKLAKSIGPQGGKYRLFQADLSVESETEEMIDAISRSIGTVDILINNAGIYPLTLLVEMSEAEWREVIDANLTSCFFTTKAVSAKMIEDGVKDFGGVIINIASIEGENPAQFHTHYAAAKGGVIMHTKAAALELGKYNIRVNSVSPGLIWREGLDEQWPEGVRRYTSSAPLGRLGLPEDVAYACLFLASPAARWITGVNLRVDGGIGATTGY